MQVAQGDLEAPKSYSDGLSIIERLAQSDPGNAQWQYDLGISNERIGDVQVAQGDLKAALKSYEAKRDIISRLAQSDPGNAYWQRDLSVSYAKLADAYRKSKETAKARDALAAGRAIIGKLVEQHPDQAQWKETWPGLMHGLPSRVRLHQKGNRRGDERVSPLIALSCDCKIVTSLKEEHESSASRIFSNDPDCLAPHVHSRRAKGSVRPCRSEMTLDVESVVGGCVS